MTTPMIETPGEDRPVGVIAERASYLIVNKPAGLLSVPGKTENDCLEARVRTVYPDALTVHRLDMATSGVCVMARTPEALADFQRQFEKRETTKVYEAIVVGEVAGDQGTVDTPIRRDWDLRPLQVIDHELGKETLTDWRVIDREPGRTRLELRPRTGRTHQLRLHMKSIGHPILGDEWYADEMTAAASERLLLHATELGFRAPPTGEIVAYQSPCPF